jgi:hypothetical protein
MDNGYEWYAAPPYDLEIEDDKVPMATARADELLAAIDAAFPLPPPPLRAGQVWLLEARQATHTALLNTTLGSFLRPHISNDDSYGVGAFPPSEARINRIRGDTLVSGMRGGFSEWKDGYLLGDQFLPARVAEALLLHNDRMIKAYLIADPADPGFTVWTGAKEGEW